MNQDNGGIIGKINTPTTSVASGVWSIQDQFEAQSSSIWPLAFPQTTFTSSVRLNKSDSPYLNRTNGTATNNDKRYASVFTGTQTAALLTGGSSPQTANVESWDGSSWSAETSFPGALFCIISYS